VPLYEYECDACGRRFEVIQKFSDPPVEQCKECGKGPVHRLPSSPAIQFKGTGWYVTDYAKSSSNAPTKTDTPKTDSANSETKTETKTDTKSEPKSDSSATGSRSKE
jgi:putative FmdB family regulatory protein